MAMYKITPEQKAMLEGQEFAKDEYFGPIDDINGDWFISDIEISKNTNPNFSWLADLVESIFIPKQLPNN